MTAARVSAPPTEKSNACGFCGRCGQARRSLKKAQKEEPTCEAAAPAYVGSGKGNGLRLPFLCVQVIGCLGWEVEPHPSEPFE